MQLVLKVGFYQTNSRVVLDRYFKVRNKSINTRFEQSSSTLCEVLSIYFGLQSIQKLIFYRK